MIFGKCKKKKKKKKKITVNFILYNKSREFFIETCSGLNFENVLKNYEVMQF